MSENHTISSKQNDKTIQMFLRQYNSKLTDRIRANLTSQVYFNTTVDCSHFWISADNFSVIDIINFKHFDEWIVVDKIVELFRSDQETANNSTTMNDFLIISDASFIDEINNATREHL